MQSSWSRWCQLHLDPRIERGTPKRLTQREHVHAEVYAQIKDEVREELRASLRAEVREELAREEVEAARRIAKEVCERHKVAEARHNAARLEITAQTKMMRKQLDAAEAEYRAIMEEVAASNEALKRERAEADARAMLLRQARAASDPHLAHLGSLMERYASEASCAPAEAKRQAVAASLAFHEELKRLLLDRKHSNGSDLMSALSAIWGRHPENPLRVVSAAADHRSPNESRLGT